MLWFIYKYFILSRSHFGIWLNCISTFLVGNLRLIFNVPQATFLYYKHIFMMYLFFFALFLLKQSMQVLQFYFHNIMFSTTFFFSQTFFFVFGENFDLNTFAQNSLRYLSFTNFIFNSILRSRICFKNRFKNPMARYIFGICRHFLPLWISRHFLSSR